MKILIILCILIAVMSLGTWWFANKNIDYQNSYQEGINRKVDVCQHDCQRQLGCVSWDCEYCVDERTGIGIFCSEWTGERPSTTNWNMCMEACGV